MWPHNDSDHAGGTCDLSTIRDANAASCASPSSAARPDAQPSRLFCIATRDNDVPAFASWPSVTCSDFSWAHTDISSRCSLSASSTLDCYITARSQESRTCNYWAGHFNVTAFDRGAIGHYRANDFYRVRPKYDCIWTADVNCVRSLDEDSGIYVLLLSCGSVTLA